MNASLTLRRLVTLIGFVALACDGDAPSPKLELRPAEGETIDQDAEAERMRRMQRITLIDTFDGNKEVEFDELSFVNNVLGGTCTFGDTCRLANHDCEAICDGVVQTCHAETFLALTRPQGLGFRLGGGGRYQFPQQSEATMEQLATLGLGRAAGAADNFLKVLRGAGKLDFDQCQDGNEAFMEQAEPGVFVSTGTTLGVVAGTGLARAFDVYKQLVDAAVTGAVSTSDSELGSTTSTALASQRAIRNWRLKAARYLGGSAMELKLDENGAFCSRPHTTPAVRAAIAVIRDAAPSPTDILSGLDTATLIDGEGAAVPDGSVRERLADFYFGAEDLPDNKTVGQQYDLDMKSFEDARAFLKEEIVAFSRSKTALLKGRSKPNGELSSHKIYAGTASAPARLPAAYYGALTHVENNLNALDGDLNVLPKEDYNARVPGFIAAAQTIIGASTNQDATLSDAALGPLGMMLAPRELLGRITAYQTTTPNTNAPRIGVRAYGFDANDGIKLALNEDDLRCAVQGSIEGGANVAGEPCSLAGLLPFSTISSNSETHSKVARAYLTNEERRVYLLKPRRGPATVPTDLLPPGSYDALIGVSLTIHPDLSFGSEFAIVRGNDERIAALLEPSSDWCARPRVNCTGKLFDERIPLEDELTDDGDGVESSWKHYLDLAAAAANEADLLGNDYINSSLQNAQNLQSNEEREQQQLQYASQQLQQLQTLCGINANVDSILRKLQDELDENRSMKTTNDTCTTGGSCPSGFTCVGQTSFADTGRCTFDLDAFIENSLDDLGDDADVQRIRDCLSGGGIVPFVSLGDKPLCLWRQVNNPNLICRLQDPVDPNALVPANPEQCPRVVQSEADCTAAIFSDLPTAPTGAEFLATTALNYFEMTNDTVINEKGGLQIRYGDVRALSRSTWPTLGKGVIKSNLLDRTRLGPVASGLDWEARVGGFSAITYLGVPLYTTGSAEDGPPLADPMHPELMRWPCGPADRPWFSTGGRPQNYNCSTTEGRAAASVEMFAAVAEAKLLALVDPEFDEDRGRVLLPFGTVEHVADGDGACTECSASRTLILPGGSAIQERSCKGGTSYSNSTGELGCFHLGKLHEEYYEVENFAGVALNGLSESTPIVGLTFSRLDHTGWEGEGWIRQFLEGSRHLTDRVGVLSWKSDDARIPGGFPLETPSASHALYLYGQDLMMGLGLLARAAGDPPNLSLSAVPPKITSVEDLASVKIYIDELARQIRNNTGGLVFSQMPLTVKNALRNESANGSFPQFGGNMQGHISMARSALLRIRQNGPLIANEVRQLGAAIESLRILLQKSAIKKDINRLQLLSTINDRMTQCATAISGAIQEGSSVVENATSFGAKGAAAATGAILTCANSIAQTGIATDIAQLQGQDAQLDGELALADFDGKFSAHATAIQTLGFNLAGGFEDLDTALAAIENTRAQARSALASAISAASFQAKHQAEVTNVIGNLSTAKQIRYIDALKNAKRLAFLAKRAIEQRLGVSLATITEDYPLVDAPSKWESTVCEFTGLDYSKLIGANSDAPQSYAKGFIGDYVQKLANFVESYRLQHNFHEGTDTAVISLRDDLMNVRKPCLSEGPNLLYNAGQLNEGLQPGWGREGCSQTVNGIEEPVADCANVDPLLDLDGAPDSPRFADESLAKTTGYRITFGSGAASTASSAVIQPVELRGGVYRLSWYTKESGTSGGSGAWVLRDEASDVTSECDGSSGTCIVNDEGLENSPVSGGWNRRFVLFRVNAQKTVRVGFKKPASGTTITVSAPMLERLQDLEIDQALTPFVNTSDTLSQVQATCEDSEGTVFRSTRWNRNCMKLCADGFADNCSVGKSKSYCYWEAQFGFSQRDIQIGKVFNYSGFARGNFNYRIDSVGLNMVGSSTRDCSGSESPETCYGGGYIPYSLSHTGPFYVRNFRGEDVEAKVFDGNIEHARGLATERYLTNPLSGTDQTLIEQFMRREFAGRPLDGNFVLRVWEEDGVDFTAIEDVQVVLNYRYWTKFD